jgi:hypothetical protein
MTPPGRELAVACTQWNPDTLELHIVRTYARAFHVPLYVNCCSCGHAHRSGPTVQTGRR